MKVHRILISSWTSSFRYPNIISGYQPTLEVPPISTILGLINACAGKYLDYNGLQLGYYFDYEMRSTDLETIYQIELNDKGTPKNQVKSNVISREFLYDCRLFLYLFDDNLVEYLKKPVYQVLLGRSSDLATIEKVELVEIEEVINANKIRGQIVPFNGNFLPGTLQALPKYFTNTLPRNNIGAEAYSVIPYYSKDYQTSMTACRDVIDGKDVDIYIHKLNFDNEQ